jgi:polyisoprenoid-binding protein YceI
MKVLFLFLLIALTFESSGQKTLDNVESEIKFMIQNAGFEVVGSIEMSSLKFNFNPSNLGQSAIEALANPLTIQTGIAIRDKHLKRSDYFYVDQYPEIKMSSKSFTKIGKDKFTGLFDLTIKGIVKEISLPFKQTKQNDATHYTGKFEINRLDFNLGEKSALLSEKVIVLITLKRP